MKIVHRDLVPHGPGRVKLIPEESEDLWHLYNLIAKGDTVKSQTVRKVIKETDSGRRLDPERVRLSIEIKVEAVDYDQEGGLLRIRGVNIKENEYIKFGQYHTLEIEQQRPLFLSKDVWDSLALDILKDACGERKRKKEKEEDRYMDSYMAVADLMPVLPPLPYFLPPFHFFPRFNGWVDLDYDGQTSIILLAAAIVLPAPTPSSLSLSPPSAPSLPFRKKQTL